MGKRLALLVPLVVLLGFVSLWVLLGLHPAADYVLKGNLLLKQGKTQEACINYRKAIQKDSNYGEAYYYLGIGLLQMNLPQEALPAFERAYQLLPARKEVKVTLADLSMSALVSGWGNATVLHNRIATISDQLLAEDARSFDGLRLKGALAASDLRFAQAEKLLRSANEVQPMQPQVITGWMQALFRLGRPAEAETLGWKLIAGNKTYTPAYDELYSHYIGVNRLADAERVLKIETENNPASLDAALRLAGFYRDHAKPGDMKATLQRLMDSPKTFPQAALQVGDFYAGRQEWSEAIRVFETGAKERPEDKVVYLKRIVDAWLAQDKPEMASSAVGEILKAQPADDSVKAVATSLRMASGEPADINAAVAEYQSLVAKNPRNSVWRYALGRALAAQGDTNGARTQQQEAIRIQPDFVAPRLALAEISERLGDYQAALRYTTESIALTPDHPGTRLAHVVSLRFAGRLAECRSELTRLQKEYPGEPQLPLELAYLDIAERKLAQAEERLRTLLQANHDDPEAVSVMARVLELEGRSSQAFVFVQNTLNRFPDSDDIRSLLADMALRMRKPELAIECYQRLAARHPTREQPFFGLGMAYRAKQDLPAAILSFQKAGEVAPKDPRIGVLLGELFAGAGRRKEAVAAYRKAYKLEPNNPGFTNDLAYQIAESGGNLNEALELAKKATARDPGQPYFADTLGWIYVKMRFTDSAVQILRGLTERYADNPIFRYHLGVALLQKGDRNSAQTELRTALSKDATPDLRAQIESALSQNF